MSQTRALRAGVEYVEACLRAIHNRAGDAPLDPDAQRRFDEGAQYVRDTRDRIAVLERVERSYRAGSFEGGTAQDGVTAFQALLRDDPWERETLSGSPSELRGRALTALERAEGMPDFGRERATRAVETADDSGQLARWIVEGSQPDYFRAFAKLVRDPEHGSHEWTDAERAAYQRVRTVERAMSIGTDAAGGYGVPVMIDPAIILTGQRSLNPMRRISRVETVITDEWKGVSSAGVTWSWDAEGSAVSDDSPTLAQPTVTVHMARGFIPYSIEVGQDYPRFADEMSRLLMEGYDELTAAAFITGTGSGQPRGILTALDANTNVEVVVTTDGAFGGVDINKVWGALPDRWKANATWLMSHDVANEVATFGNSNNLSFVSVDLTGVVSTLRMRPVEFSSYMPDFTGTTGASNIAIVGDFRNYLIADRAPTRIELVPHLFDVTNNRPTGQRGLFAWARAGGNALVDDGFRVLQNQ